MLISEKSIFNRADGAVVYFLNELLTVNWLALVIEITLGIGVYLLLLIVFKVELINKLRKKLCYAE